MSYTFRVIYKFDSETGSVYACIPRLGDLSDFGDSFEEAESNIMAAAKLYLEEHPNAKSEENVIGTQVALSV